jgi:hypothetical protein
MPFQTRWPALTLRAVLQYSLAQHGFRLTGGS